MDAPSSDHSGAAGTAAAASCSRVLVVHRLVQQRRQLSQLRLTLLRKLMVSEGKRGVPSRQGWVEWHRQSKVASLLRRRQPQAAPHTLLATAPR